MNNIYPKVKGVILAGGTGSRLFPVTNSINKQLLSVYDKPLIYYAVSLHMLAGIKNIGIVSDANNLEKYMKLFKDGKELGVKFSYIEQPEPLGIAHGLMQARSFISDDDVFFTLGDNILHGPQLTQKLISAITSQFSTILAYRAKNPNDFGVIEIDKYGKPKGLVEKPKQTNSDLISIGMYFYKNYDLSLLSKIIPSNRGEMEITDFNQELLTYNKLQVEVLDRGFAWFDCGSHSAMHQASKFVETIQKTQGFQIACLEEIAYRRNLINLEELRNTYAYTAKGEYAEYVRCVDK